MKIGLAYDLKDDVPLNKGEPDDALEEYDSLETIQGIESALIRLGHSVVRLGGGRPFLSRITQNNVDFVFNIAEGRGNCRSREAQVPAILEMLGISYSGADPQCLAISLDKPLTKKLIAMSGVKTPDWKVVASQQELNRIAGSDWPLPAFVKPVYEGSSKGIRSGSRVETPEEVGRTVTALLQVYQQPVMVEQFIAGDEVTVGMLGNSPPKVIGIMRVLPREKAPNFIYSIEVKRDWERLVDYECPAKLDNRILRKITDFSLKAFEVLGCRDFARVDFRVSEDGIPYFLEINPLAGLNPHSSDLPIMVGKLGWTYDNLIGAILNAAIERNPQCGQG